MSRLIAFIALAFLPLISSANFTGFIYTTGSEKGSVVRNTQFVGYYDICFVGNVKIASSILWNMLNQDMEKTSSFSRYDEQRNLISFGYVSTKCLDDGSSAAECRNVILVRSCR